MTAPFCRPDIDEALRKGILAVRGMVQGNEAVGIRIEITAAPRTLAAVAVAVGPAKEANRATLRII